MNNNKNKGATFSEMNVVPFIDIMLVLLIVFMCTAPAINETVKVDLPQAKADKIEVTNETPIIIITVEKNNYVKIYFNNREISISDIETLPGRVNQILSNYKNAQIFIKGDQHAYYGTVVSVMNKLKTSGINNVGLMTSKG